MKTFANSSFGKAWMVIFCLVLSAMAARAQLSGGIYASNGLQLAGSTVDSFNSSDPNHSIWQTNSFFRRNYFNPSGTQYGLWSSSLSFISNSYPSRTANVSVFTDSNVVDLSGNTTVAGYILTGPAGTVSTGSGSSVGDLAWCFGASGTGGDTGIEPGHWVSNTNLNFQSEPLPTPVSPINGWMNWSNVPALPKNSVISIGGMWTNSAGAWSYVGGTSYTNTSGAGFSIGGVTYPLIITNRLANTNWVYYSINTLTESIFVDAQYVVLYLTNGMSLTGSDVFTVNTNADIQVWTTGNISTSGSSRINNMNGYARAYSLYDVAGHPVTVSLAAGGAATGLYYIPSSTLTLSGGGSASDFVGAIACYSLNDQGHMNIHYDESLGASLAAPIIVQPLLSYDFLPANDWFICHLVGVTGLDYTIEASTNLVNWTPVRTNTSPFVFIDTNMNKFPHRFFRPISAP